ncbi:hypothetical protein [Mycobacterium bourgelatii]|uniref:Peptidase C1 n=1 Tax=Mycobacterium bourgelatii TaxID=1273442 RepID=A0A7I9YWQ4_MYCBU|nr:hypothetical protein [Mycobacterium bourgelatii]MCV6978256.1 hypothetical protein [Mycobacterium bourgelatii]GFG93002.1 hypothetical protein MBOU_50440 [Mycobacterium bourgelatii]
MILVKIDAIAQAYAADPSRRAATAPQGLDNLRTVIVSGMPIVFGTHPYNDFPHYRGGRQPYEGNGQLMHIKGKRVCHMMLIVAYDDDFTEKVGAVRIQNRFGNRWGKKVFVWMAYDA